MTNQKHIINKQVLEIKLRTRKDAGLIQDTVSRAYKNHVIPVIERLADRYAGNGNSLTIDKIEIDIGGISLEKLNSDFPQKVEQILEEILIGKLHERELEIQTESSHSEKYDVRREKNNLLKITSGEDARLEILKHFLLTGALPWWSSSDVSGSVQGLVEELLEKSAAKTERLLLILLKTQSVRKRFVYQFEEQTIRRAINLFIPSNADGLTELIVAINTVQLYRPLVQYSSSGFKLITWEFALKYIVENVNLIKNDQLNESDFVEYILKSHLSESGKGLTAGMEFSAFLFKLSKSVKDIKKEHGIPELMKLDEVLTILQQKSAEPAEPEGAVPSGKPLKQPYGADILQETTEINQIQPGGETGIKTNENLQKTPENEAQEPGKLDEPAREGVFLSEKPLLAGNQIPGSEDWDPEFLQRLKISPGSESEHISNAGLVLLCPYLTRLFERVNYVKNKQFINDPAKYRALHLLQYLVTEQEETPEHALLLNKIVCGIDLHEPVPLGFKITENELAECNGLLQSVIEHWTALKNTSIHGLRVTFLQRDGILSKQPGGWKLNIERTTVNVLLDRLPWTISMIALPWSKEMIYVEW